MCDVRNIISVDEFEVEKGIYIFLNPAKSFVEIESEKGSNNQIIIF